MKELVHVIKRFKIMAFFSKRRRPIHKKDFTETIARKLGVSHNILPGEKRFSA